MAKEVVEVRASRGGFVTDLDALAIGLTGVAMGAGRTRADQAVDPSVGIAIDAKPGDAVRVGQVVARLFVREKSHADGLAERVSGAFSYGGGDPSLTSRRKSEASRSRDGLDADARAKVGLRFRRGATGA